MISIREYSFNSLDILSNSVNRQEEEITLMGKPEQRKLPCDEEGFSLGKNISFPFSCKESSSLMSASRKDKSGQWDIHLGN